MMRIWNRAAQYTVMVWDVDNPSLFAMSETFRVGKPTHRSVTGAVVGWSVGGGGLCIVLFCLHVRYRRESRRADDAEARIIELSEELAAAQAKMECG